MKSCLIMAASLFGCSWLISSLLLACEGDFSQLLRWLLSAVTLLGYILGWRQGFKSKGGES